MNKFELIKNMSIDEMASAIIELSSDCSKCDCGCIVGDADCMSCTLSRLKEVEE